VFVGLPSPGSREVATKDVAKWYGVESGTCAPASAAVKAGGWQAVQAGQVWGKGEGKGLARAAGAESIRRHKPPTFGPQR